MPWLYAGNSLFSSQDLLGFQELGMFSSNLGLDDEWYLPSQPSIVQILLEIPARTTCEPRPPHIHVMDTHLTRANAEQAPN
jgi:hypothetical protein